MKKIFLSLLILITHFSYGQEMWGISNSNYSGNMGIFLNPSTIVGAPYKYEINIVAADFFAENSYIYFPQDKHIVWNSITGNNEPGKNYSYMYWRRANRRCHSKRFWTYAYYRSELYQEQWRLGLGIAFCYSYRSKCIGCSNRSRIYSVFRISCT